MENLNDLGSRFFPTVSRKEHDSSCLGVCLVRPSQRIHQAKLCPTFASREIVRCLSFKDANFVVICDNGNGKLQRRKLRSKYSTQPLAKCPRLCCFPQAVLFPLSGSVCLPLIAYIAGEPDLLTRKVILF